MTLRMNVENALRTEIILSFNDEPEAKAWLDDFQKAAALYAESKEGEQDTPVPVEVGSKPMEAPAPKKGAKK